MKKIVICTACIFIFLLSGCSGDQSYCEICGDPCGDGSVSYKDVTFCENCVGDDISKCLNCNQFFLIDHLFSSDHYCPECAPEFTASCCLCGAGYLEYTSLVSIRISQETHYMCAECSTEYLEDTSFDKPFECCIMH